MSQRMWRAWKNFYGNESARPHLAGQVIRDRLNSSGLSRHRTREDAIVIHTHQKNGVRIHGVGREIERRGRRERGCQRQGVWACSWRSDGERAAELNIKELLPRSELIEIHDAAGVISRCRSQIQLADEVHLIGIYSTPNKREVPPKRGRRDGTDGLGQECAVACDPGVSLLE